MIKNTHVDYGGSSAGPFT